MEVIKIKSKRKLFVLLLTVFIVFSNLLVVANSVKAVVTENGESKNIYIVGRCDGLLKYKTKPVGITFVAYKGEDGIEYPAYCVNRNLDGVGELPNYDVTIDGAVTNAGLWRLVSNGYPYKTPEELGCDNKNEAFAATKLAVYAYLYDYDVNDFEGVGEAGERTLNALKEMVKIAREGTQVKVSSDLDIEELDKEWKVDEKDSNYVSKTYTVSAAVDIESYTVKLENAVDEVVLANEENEKQDTFNAKENFKVLIPFTSIERSGEFTIKAEADVKTKIVLYGKAPNSDLQNYAVTTAGFELGQGELAERYNENTTKINIIKKDRDNSELLQGVEFELLDSDKKVIYSGLVTDENGSVVIDNLKPGRYYLRETKTVKDYELYEGLVEIDIDLNEEKNIIFENWKGEQKVETTITRTNTLKASQMTTKLPKTGN